jgi:predicted unusual protein kinase regulating ubiquinone biosynthesis (AarF/ABC1/UbiB family)
VPAPPFELVQRTIERSLGGPLDAHFSSVNRVPLAAASIASVYEAILPSGQHVVIKVRRPNIARLMPEDFHHLAVVMRFVAWLNPDYDFRPVVEEWSREALRELDFVHEAKNMQRVRENLAQLNVQVIIPRTVANMVQAEVLVMEFAHGFKITNLEKLNEYGVDRHALVRRVAQALAAQIYYFGLFNGDSHSGNFLVQIHNGHAIPVLLDFGLTKELSGEMKRAFASMVVSVAESDFAGLLMAFEGMGVKLKRQAPLEDMRALQFALRDTEAAAISRKTNREFMSKRMIEREKKPAKLRNPVESWPTELVFYMRTTALLRGLCSNLDVKLPYLDILLPYARLALINKIPRSLHATTIIYPSPPLSSLDSKLRSLVEQFYNENELSGCQISVYQKGKKIVELAAGTFSRVDPRPVTPSTLFNAFSVTKPVSAAIVHMLLDGGISYAAGKQKPKKTIEYDDSVAKYWPEFAKNNKGNCTIRQLLSHQAGLEGAVTSQTPIKSLCNYELMCKTVAEAVPSGQIPCKPAYHYLSYGFCTGGLVSAITGRGMREIVSEDVAARLGIEGEFYIGLPRSELSRCSTLVNGLGMNGEAPKPEEIQFMLQKIKEIRKQQRAKQSQNGVAASNTRSGSSSTNGLEEDEEFDWEAKATEGEMSLIDPLMLNLPDIKAACIPAANGHFSARALAKFNAALANDGIIDGVRILSAGKSAKIFTKIEAQSDVEMPSLNGAAANSSSSSLHIQWGKGVRIYQLSNHSTPAYGHSGLGGSFVLNHSATSTSIVILINKLTLRARFTKAVLSLCLKEFGLELASDIAGPDAASII